MKVVSISRGFTTNSSSRDVVLIDRRNLRTGNNFDFDPEKDFHFGKDFVKLETVEAKKIFLAAQYNKSFSSRIPQEDIRLAVINKLAETNFDRGFISDRYENENHYNLTFDHQSNWEIPTDAPIEFYLDLLSFISDPRVVIVVGSDEWDPTIYDLETKMGKKNVAYDIITSHDRSEVKKLRDYYVEYSRELLPFFRNTSKNELYPMHIFGKEGEGVLKKEGEYWIYFNRTSGDIRRFTFNLDPEIDPYTKSIVPETVDLNITDKCFKDCKICYKDCSSKGTHADFENVRNYITALSNSGVFEIALGGGEPTLHPDFAKILCLGRKKTKRPHIKIGWNEENLLLNPKASFSFSTGTCDWLSNKEIVKTVRDRVSSIGYSIHYIWNIPDLIKVYKTVNKDFSAFGLDHDPYSTRWKRVEVTAQVVMGERNFSDLMEILKELKKHRVPILLLGYKKTGRGEKVQPHKYTYRELKKLNKFLRKSDLTISIDTCFTEQYQSKVIDKLGIEAFSYRIREGQYSCYIDAVSNKIASSSFSEELINLENGSKISDILNIFKTF